MEKYVQRLIDKGKKDIAETLAIRRQIYPDASVMLTDSDTSGRSSKLPHPGELERVIAAATYEFILDKQRYVANLKAGKYGGHNAAGLIARGIQKYADKVVLVEVGAKNVQINQGIVILPTVADCLGIMVRNNAGDIVASHLPSLEYSFADIEQAVHKASTGKPSQLEIALAGMEAFHLSEGLIHRHFPDDVELKDFRYPSSDIPLIFSVMKARLTSLIPDGVTLKRLTMKLQTDNRTGNIPTLHTMFASTAEPGMHIRQSFGF